MKKAPAVKSILLFLLLWFACPGWIHEGHLWASSFDTQTERIISFNSRIEIQRDSSMTVTETIRVHAEGKEIKRGIFRDFPTTYSDRFGKRYVVKFDVMSVTRDGAPDGYQVEEGGNGKRLYIGRKDFYLRPGEYEYTITYMTNRQLGFFHDHDELYWNVTGNGWVFPIESAAATVILPDGAAYAVTGAEGYTGPTGAKGKDYSISRDGSGNLLIRTTGTLGPKEGLTIVVTWPKGYVVEPTASDKARFFLNDNRGTLIGFGGVVILFLFYLTLWVKFGRDPEKGTVIPLFHEPSGLSPASVRYIMEMGYDAKVLAAALINMAVKGFLAIEGKEGGYILRKLRDGMAGLSPDESIVAKRLFEGGVTSLDLKSPQRRQAIVQVISELKTSLKNTCDKVYFITNKKYFITGLVLSGLIMFASTVLGADSFPVIPVFLSVWLTFWTCGVAVLLTRVAALWKEVFSVGGIVRLGSAIFFSLFTAPFVLGEIFALGALAMATSFWTIGILGAIVCINLLFYHLLKAPTRMGREVMDRIEGMKMYLTAAEKDRLDTMNPPERTPALFEKFLPYALALDVENQWAEQFADQLSLSERQDHGYAPKWYIGSSVHVFSPGGLSGFTGALTGAIASSSSSPGSSSGSGGGGSSGGGGGGGGGGGW